MKKYGVVLIIAFLMQLAFANLLTIRGTRPDFLVIFVLYFAIHFGSYKGVLAGFIVGIIVSFFDSGINIGALSLVYSIVGYAGGFLNKYRNKMVLLYFNIYSFIIIIVSFFLYTMFTHKYYFSNDFSLFLIVWLKSTIYTITIMLLLQFIIPLHKS